MTQHSQLQHLIKPIFKRIGMCISSPHFQVSQRALFLFHNNALANFMSSHKPQILPIIYPALCQNINSHWNTTVTELTQHILQQFLDMDQTLYNCIIDNYKLQQSLKIKEREKFWNEMKESNVSFYNIQSRKPYK